MKRTFHHEAAKNTKKTLSSWFLVFFVSSWCSFAFCAERAAEPPAERPGRRTPVDQARIDDANPRVKLKKEALASTMSTMLDSSLSAEKRINAIGLAGLACLTETIPALVAILKRNDDIEVKVATVWALREIGDPTAIPALLLVQSQAVGPAPVLRYDKKIAFPDLGIEMTFIELIEDGIGRLGEQVITRYIKLLTAPSGSYRDTSESIINMQRSALAVIICVGDRDYRAIEAMKNILGSPAEVWPADFRQAAAFGLGRVLVARTKEFAVVRARDPVGDEITELLAEFLIKLEPGTFREYVAGALSNARPEYAVTLLTRHFADNSAEQVRMRVIEALGLLRSREAVEALAWALEHEKNPELRWRAALGLGLSGKSDAAVKALSAALKDESLAVRRAAIDALGQTGAKNSVKLVAPNIKDPDPKIRAAAARALGLSRDKAAVPLLLPAAADDDVVVRATTIAALGAIPSIEGLGAIVKAARDPERPVRFAALQILSRIHGFDAYEALLGLAGDPDRKIKQDASNALLIAKEQHPTELKAALIHVITDPKHPASADACDFADFPGDKAIVEALRKAALDTRPGVRGSALRMLHQMGVK